ncbi:MAG: hypothetical protein IPK10_11415 [Bacteroidetes bacterium]|nr:hypothetical protein [Bacteroidota bacterium]
MKKQFLIILLTTVFSIPVVGQLQFQKRINFGAGESARSLIKQVTEGMLLQVSLDHQEQELEMYTL